eukprot:4616407-Amphidinium_carterae.1
MASKEKAAAEHLEKAEKLVAEVDAPAPAPVEVCHTAAKMLMPDSRNSLRLRAESFPSSFQVVQQRLGSYSEPTEMPESTEIPQKRKSNWRGQERRGVNFRCLYRFLSQNPLIIQCA